MSPRRELFRGREAGGQVRAAQGSWKVRKQVPQTWARLKSTDSGWDPWEADPSSGRSQRRGRNLKRQELGGSRDCGEL